MVKFYCEHCEEKMPIIIDAMKTDKLNPNACGDIVCAECFFVIATVTVSEPGVYDFVKIKDVDDLRNSVR